MLHQHGFVILKQTENPLWEEVLQSAPEPQKLQKTGNAESRELTPQRDSLTLANEKICVVERAGNTVWGGATSILSSVLPQWPWDT